MEAIDLVGPCGIYCGSCRHYLVLKKDLLEKRGLKKGCEGCRIQNKNCSFIKRDCRSLRKKEYEFCIECEDFPCQNLIKLDNRHRRNYGDKPIDNLKKIKKIGLEMWSEEQKNIYACPRCGGEICIHDEECYDCGYKYNPHKEWELKR
jgi:hypothetical protein